MILTKDNLLRFVREKKYVIPADVAESFETSTMIASAALSELAKDKLVLITFLKLSSTPYYYDPNQKAAIIELGEKHLSKYEKDVFLKLKSQEILNDNALSIQERLAIEKLRDFAIPLDIEHSGKILKFWVWFLRDVAETRKQILDVLNPKSQSSSEEQLKTPKLQPVSEKPKVQVQKEIVQQSVKSASQNSSFQMQKSFSEELYEEQEHQPRQASQKTMQSFSTKSFARAQSHSEESKAEGFIENYLQTHYLKIESKNRTEKTIIYTASLSLNRMKVYFDCIFYLKKPTDSEIIAFYTSSPKPKIVFIENTPKKLFSLADNLVNLEIVNI